MMKNPNVDVYIYYKILMSTLEVWFTDLFGGLGLNG